MILKKIHFVTFWKRQPGGMVGSRLRHYPAKAASSVDFHTAGGRSQRLAGVSSWL